MSTDAVYVSQVTIRRLGGPHRTAELPAESQPVHFGVHGAIAAHYGTDLSATEPHAATLDYVVAAAAGWLTGTFAGALVARKIPLEKDDLVGRARGDIVKTDDGVLLIRRIHVTYELRLPESHRSTAERAHEVHASRCPVARSLERAIEITTEVRYV